VRTADAESVYCVLVQAEERVCVLQPRRRERRRRAVQVVGALVQDLREAQAPWPTP
jgi:hypothetical protein